MRLHSSWENIDGEDFLPHAFVAPRCFPKWLLHFYTPASGFWGLGRLAGPWLVDSVELSPSVAGVAGKGDGLLWFQFVSFVTNTERFLILFAIWIFFFDYKCVSWPYCTDFTRECIEACSS